MKKKKSTQISKKKKPQGRPGKVALITGEVVKQRFRGDEGTTPVHPEPKHDYESGPEPEDEASKHAYPPPKKDPIFRKYWMKFIDSVTLRKDFRIGHLDTLRILCDLHTQYEDLDNFLRINGRFFKVVNRFGETRKVYPETVQFEKVIVNIKNYTKMLGLFPKTDDSAGKGGENKNDEWE